MNLRPRHNIRIASVLLINNQHAPRPSHLTFTPTSHLYTYIYCLAHTYHTASTASIKHLYYTASTASSACLLPHCLARLKRIPTTLPQLPRAPAYYLTASRASSAYLPHCLNCLERLPTTSLPRAPQAHTYLTASRASSAYLPHCQIRFRPARNHLIVRY
jgi:hypothetical protein